jgi:hypothetical protein
VGAPSQVRLKKTREVTMARLTLESLDRRDLMSANLVVAGVAPPPPPSLELENALVSSWYLTRPETADQMVQNVQPPDTGTTAGSLYILPYIEQDNLYKAYGGTQVGTGLTAPLGSTKGSVVSPDGTSPQGIIAVLIGL